MDVYHNFSHPFQNTGDIAFQELADCELKDLDINYNDPSFDSGQYNVDGGIVYPQHSDKYPLNVPADLTNLQWLQNMNVAIPVDRNTSVSHQIDGGNVMVDPNTAMPVQHTNINGCWPSSNQIQVQTLHQQQLALRRDKPKKTTNVPISAKDDKNYKEKNYPKPVFSYSCLIAMALQDSEAGTLPVSEIYKFMQ